MHLNNKEVIQNVKQFSKTEEECNNCNQEEKEENIGKISLDMLIKEKQGFLSVKSWREGR
jgi:hypothetical protein